MFEENPKETDKVTKEIETLLLEQLKYDDSTHYIEHHHLEMERAVFYDNDLTTYGILTIKSKKSEEDDLFYFYVVDTLDINMMSAHQYFDSD